MSDSENLTFLAYYDQPSESLADPRRVRQLIGSFLASGYSWTDGYAWPFTAPKNTVALEASTPITSDAVTALHFWRFPFEFELSLDGAGRRQWVLQTSVDTLLGAARDLGPANAQAFVSAVAIAVGALNPDFGCAFWGPLDPPAEIPDSPETVASAYPLLYFGPRRLTASDRAALTAEPADVSLAIAGGLLVARKLERLFRLTD